MNLRKELEQAINRYSAENGSNTPDFILAEFLASSLRAFDAAVRAREGWYSREAVAPDAPAKLLAFNDDELIGNLMVDFVQAARMTDRDISYGSDIHLGVKAVVEALRAHEAEAEEIERADTASETGPTAFGTEHYNAAR